MDEKQAYQLREPFPPSVIGKLPRGGTNLDYVGHAATTDRLLTVDREWTWEPLAVGSDGLPAMDAAGNLWIRLTVCGVTRLGVGDGKNQKERIGDAIRNAAMRFGVAIDLWAKEDLHTVRESTAPPKTEPSAARESVRPDETGELITPRQLKALHTLFSKRGITDRADGLAFIERVIGRDVESSKELTRMEAGMVLDELSTGQGDEPPEAAGDADPWRFADGEVEARP